MLGIPDQFRRQTKSPFCRLKSLKASERASQRNTFNDFPMIHFELQILVEPLEISKSSRRAVCELSRVLNLLFKLPFNYSPRTFWSGCFASAPTDNLKGAENFWPSWQHRDIQSLDGINLFKMILIFLSMANGRQDNNGGRTQCQRFATMRTPHQRKFCRLKNCFDEKMYLFENFGERKRSSRTLKRRRLEDDDECLGLQGSENTH